MSGANYNVWEFLCWRAAHSCLAGTALLLLVLTESLYTPELRCRRGVESKERHVPAAKSFVGKSMRTMQL
jgi:hypothetical protein